MAKMLRRVPWLLVTIIALCLPLVASAQDRGDPCELISVGNDYLTVWVYGNVAGADRGEPCDIGQYGVVTGPLHPTGAGLDILQDGDSPLTSFNTVHSYTSGNTYVLSDGVTLDSVGPGVYPLAGVGETTVISPTELQMTFDTSSLDVNDNLSFTVNIAVFGTTLEDTKARVRTTVQNLNQQVADRGNGTDIGIRHLWDFALDVSGGVQENGPYFQHNPTFTSYFVETSFSGAALPTTYEMQAFPEFASYWAAGSGTDIEPFPEEMLAERVPAVTIPPTQLDYVCAPLAAEANFIYTTTAQGLAEEDTDCSPDPTGDSGVAYYWIDETTTAERGADGINLQPGESFAAGSWIWSYGFPPPQPDVLCLTLQLDATQVAATQLGIPNFQNNDVVCSDDALDPQPVAARGEGDGTFEMFFDGSDVGITRTIIDGMDILQPPFFSKPGVARGSEEEPIDVLLSFNIAHSIPPIGLVLQSDIIRFVAEENGPSTDGAFKRFFDGSDIGLQAPGENIDAFAFQENFFIDEMASRGMEFTLGDLFFSTSGNLRIPGLQARDEDIVVCWGYNFTLLPGGDIESTCEEIELFFDGSAAGLDADSEDVDAFSFGGGRLRGGFSGDLYLSTRGNFEISSVGAVCADRDERVCAERGPAVTISGRNEDVFRCQAFFPPPPPPADRGLPLPISGCGYVDIVFDGSDYGLGPNNVYSIDLLPPPCIINGGGGGGGGSRGPLCPVQ